MSTLTIKGLRLGADIDDLLELKNSHGGAPVIWDAMGQKYLGLRKFGYNTETERLWPLWRDMSIPKSFRAVLLMTYDDVIIAKEHFARAAADLRAFLTDFPPDPQYVNHLASLAEVFESQPDYDGIGFHWTSVCEDPFGGSYDEDTDEHMAHDYSQNWSLYARLDKLDDTA